MKENITGIIFTAFIGLMAYLVASFFELSAVLIALFFGLLVSSLGLIKKPVKPGIKYSASSILNLAIIGLGASLNTSILTDLGILTLIVIITIVAFTILIGYAIARIFKLSSACCWLLSLGSGICGSAAIAGSAPLVKASEQEVGVTIAIINFIGTIGLVLVPTIGFYLFNDQILSQAILIGGSLPAVGQVAAAGFVVNDDTGQLATVVKMARILLLGPVLILIALRIRHSDDSNSRENSGGTTYIPSFIIGFIILAFITNLGILDTSIINAINAISKALLIVAMTGIGLSIVLKDLIKLSLPVLLAGGCIFIIQLLFIILIIFTFYN